MLEFTLVHDGRNWIAGNDVLTASAATLEELDAEIGRLLTEMGRLKRGESITVFMCYDNSTIPQWIRQYSQHYFNRIVELVGTSS
jgi:arylsulfatase A-like enzyme